MKSQISKVLKVTTGAAMLLTALTGAANAAYYAKAISGTTVYSLEAASPGSSITSSTFWQGGSSLAGIATHGNYVFVSDNTSSGAVLHVMTLGGTYVGKVNLSTDGAGVQNAGSVSVDNSGRVYVTDRGQNSSARFASIYAPNWSNLNSGLDRVYTSITGNWQVDSAAYASGAAVVSRNDNNTGINPDGDIGGASGYTVDNSGNRSDRGVVQGSPAIPVTVTTDRGTGNTYIVSNLTTIDSNFNYVRSITLTGRSANWDDLGSVSFANAIAHDITFISDGVTDYIAMVGIANGALQTWKVGLQDGVPSATYTNFGLGADQSAAHYCAASADGKMLWVTAQASGKVYGVNFGDWSGLGTGYGSGLVDAQIGDIAVHDAAAVPEPSSIVSLLALGAGAFGFRRKRK